MKVVEIRVNYKDTPRLRIHLQVPSVMMALGVDTVQELLSCLDELDKLRAQRDERRFWKKCPNCEGSGNEHIGGMYGLCSNCKGEGRVQR